MPPAEPRVLTPVSLATTAGAVAVLAPAALAGPGPAALAVALLGTLLAAGWPRLLDLPSPRGVQAVLVVSALLTPAAALVGDDLRWVAVASATTLVASFLHQLLRTDGRARLVATLAGTALGAAVLALGAFAVAAARDLDGAALPSAVAVSAAATAAADLALHGRGAAGPPWLLLLTAVAGGAAGAGAGVVAGGDLGPSLLVGLGAALSGQALRQVLTALPTARWKRAQAAAGAASALVVAPVLLAAAARW